LLRNKLFQISAAKYIKVPATIVTIYSLAASEVVYSPRPTAQPTRIVIFGKPEQTFVWQSSNPAFIRIAMSPNSRGIA
jgi:hypothetical protein